MEEEKEGKITLMKEQLYLAKIEVKELWLNMEALKSSYNEAKENWKIANEVVEEIDYNLALIDGRLKVIKSETKTKNIKLTLEQIQHVAKVLGIDIGE